METREENDQETVKFWEKNKDVGKIAIVDVKLLEEQKNPLADAKIGITDDDVKLSQKQNNPPPGEGFADGTAWIPRFGKLNVPRLSPDETTTISFKRIKTTDGIVSGFNSSARGEVEEGDEASSSSGMINVVSGVSAADEVRGRILVKNYDESRLKMGAGGSSLKVFSKEDKFPKGDPVYDASILDVIFHAFSSCTSGDHGVPVVEDDEDNENRLNMVAGSYYKPKKSLDKPFGQDAHFVHYDEKGRVTIGVADGVGGCSRKGIDSGVYARELMYNSVYVLQQHKSDSPVDPKQVLQNAWLNTKAKGASTACIITLSSSRDNHNLLRAVNLGDSGFMVIRDRDSRKVMYKSRIQQSNFNHPFQLRKASKTGFSPNDAQEIELQVENGDVLIVATDGLFDNLFPAEIIDIVKRCQSINGGVLPPPTVVARALVGMAEKMSRAKKSIRPWTKAAIAAGRDRRKFKGGKYDDITVVVGYVGKFMKLLSK